jgi:hypothetical protein
MGKKRNEYKILVSKLEGKRQLGEPMHIRIIILIWFLQEWDGCKMDLFGLKQG